MSKNGYNSSIDLVSWALVPGDPDEILILEEIVMCLHCVNTSILVVILCYSFTRCYHWEKLGEGYMRSLCCFLNCLIWFCNHIKIKGLIKVFKKS
jgi:hypothetical protein